MVETGDSIQETQKCLMLRKFHIETSAPTFKKNTKQGNFLAMEAKARNVCTSYWLERHNMKIPRIEGFKVFKNYSK